MPYTAENMCFACGKANKIGLKLDFKEHEGGVLAEFVPNEYHQGYPGITHGGIVITLLDEAIAWACRIRGYDAFTAHLEVRFRNPLKIGERVQIYGKVVKEKGRLAIGEAVVKAGERIIAEAKGKFIRR